MTTIKSDSLDAELYFLHARPWIQGDEKSIFTVVKIAFVSICTCKNNWQIWRHNASISRSRDITDALWWRHNFEMSDWWLFLAELCVQGAKKRVRNKMIHSWCDLPMIFTRDFITHENIWQIASLVTQKSLKNRYSRKLMHYSLYFLIGH